MTSRVSQAAARCAATADGEAATLRPPPPVDTDETEHACEAHDGRAAAPAPAANAHRHRQPDGSTDTRASESINRPRAANGASHASDAGASAGRTGRRGPAARKGRSESDVDARERHVGSTPVTRMAPVGACALHHTVIRRRDW